MGLTTNELLRSLHDSQQASMQRMLEAWDKELDAAAEAFRQSQERHAAQQAVQALDAAALEVYLRGLIAQAQGGSDVSVTIPSGIRVASDLALGPAAAELSELVDQIDQTEANVAAQQQRSAAWALGAGLMPHPGDLSDLMRTVGVDAPFSDRLADLAKALDRPGGGPVQLQLHAAHDRLFALKDQVQVLRAYGPDRTLNLVRNPAQLSGTQAKTALPAPLDRGPTPKMGHAALGRVLDTVFSKR